MSRRRGVVSTFLSLTMVALVACGRGQDGVSEGGRPTPHFKPGFNLFSLEQDIELGRQSAEQIAREMPLLDDAATATYVRQLGARLAAKAPGHNFPYQFNVVATREINAFALPGGFIFVNAGAIAAAKNEGELAGVLAHEISHVALRHGTNQASKAYIAQAGLGVLGAIAGSGDTPELGDIINAVGGAGANMLFLRFGRTAETQADLEGARIMAAAGYDPRDMTGFFETLEAKSGGQRVPEMLSDHPDPGNRVAAINELLPSLQMGSNPTRDTPEFRQIKARLLGGGGGRGAALRSSAEPERRGPRDPNDIEPGARPGPPSTTFKTFQASDNTFAFSYPDNWDGLALRGGESNLVFAPRGGYGEIDGAVYVTHGIFIGVVEPGASDLEHANAAYVEQQIRANPDFRIHRAPEAVNFGDGRRGYATIVTGPSTITGVIEVDVIYTTTASDGRLFYLITMAPEDEFEKYHPAFEQIIRNLRLAG